MKRAIALLALSSSFFLFSCQKSIETTPQSAGSESNDVTTGSPNVYVAGQATMAPGRTIACYWRNGQLITLPSYYQYNSYATAMTLNGADRYVAGYQLFKGATFWKNGTPSYFNFADALSAANGICVNGTSIYIAGYTEYYPGNVYAWYAKDGAVTALNDRYASEAHANGIAVSANDVYVAGYESPLWDNPTYPRLWKNGQRVALSDSTIPGNLAGVAVANGDVYVAGWKLAGSNHAATYWKNGVPVNLSRKGFSTEAHSIFVAGNDVYVAGIDNYGTHNIAAYWKNGTLVSLTNGSTDAQANSIVVDEENNVWVAGTVANADGIVSAVYWKNGARVNLSKSGQDANAASIFVSRS